MATDCFYLKSLLQVCTIRRKEQLFPGPAIACYVKASLTWVPSFARKETKGKQGLVTSDRPGWTGVSGLTATPGTMDLLGGRRLDGERDAELFSYPEESSGELPCVLFLIYEGRFQGHGRRRRTDTTFRNVSFVSKMGCIFFLFYVTLQLSWSL